MIMEIASKCEARGLYSAPRRGDGAFSEDPSRHNVLLGVTGSVAAIKFKQLYDGLRMLFNVRVVATESAAKFLTTIQDFDMSMVYRDEDEWNSWREIGDPVLHIELRKWAWSFVIAPLSANTLAKISHGICDNLLTSIVRAWDYTLPLVLAPAMNTCMWNNPLTKKQLNACSDIMGEVGFIIAPVSKKLACGDVGIGAMAEPSTIIDQMSSLAKLDSNS
jgi:phosphopantothenoylcysteine decarboxylase